MISALVCVRHIFVYMCTGHVPAHLALAGPCDCTLLSQPIIPFYTLSWYQQTRIFSFSHPSTSRAPSMAATPPVSGTVVNPSTKDADTDAAAALQRAGLDRAATDERERAAKATHDAALAARLRQHVRPP